MSGWVVSFLEPITPGPAFSLGSGKGTGLSPKALSALWAFVVVVVFYLFVCFLFFDFPFCFETRSPFLLARCRSLTLKLLYLFMDFSVYFGESPGHLLEVFLVCLIVTRVLCVLRTQSLAFFV